MLSRAYALFHIAHWSIHCCRFDVAGFAKSLPPHAQSMSQRMVNSLPWEEYLVPFEAGHPVHPLVAVDTSEDDVELAWAVTRVVALVSAATLNPESVFPVALLGVVGAAVSDCGADLNN